MLNIQIIKDENAPVFVLTKVMLKKYGVEVLTWEPETMRETLNREYSIEITDLCQDKIQAGFLILTSDLYESDWRCFETCNHLINHQPDEFDDLSPLEAEELIAGVAEAMLIKDGYMEDEDDLVYTPEVRLYAGKVFYDYGMCHAPILFPSAIMPKSNQQCNDEEKNAALSEMWNEKLRVVLEYHDRME